jgi:hypothetical protein
MESKGVRCQCPQCTFSVVMHHETECPPGISKVVEGAPFCPNCDVPMKPVSSVDTSPKHTSPGLGEGLSFSDRLTKIHDAELEVEGAKSEWDKLKEAAADAKKVYDGKVVSLCSMIRRLTSVPTPGEKPLLDIAAAMCGDVHRSMLGENSELEMSCELAPGHEGMHEATSLVGPDGPPIWHNNAERQASGVELDPQCNAEFGPDPVFVCSRVKGHTGRHIDHLGSVDPNDWTIWQPDDEQAAAVHDAIVQRFHAINIAVSAVDVGRWTPPQLAEAVSYLNAREGGRQVFEVPRPAFLTEAVVEPSQEPELTPSTAVDEALPLPRRRKPRAPAGAKTEHAATT